MGLIGFSFAASSNGSVEVSVLISAAVIVFKGELFIEGFDSFVDNSDKKHSKNIIDIDNEIPKGQRSPSDLAVGTDESAPKDKCNAVHNEFDEPVGMEEQAGDEDVEDVEGDDDSTQDWAVSEIGEFDALVCRNFISTIW